RLVGLHQTQVVDDNDGVRVSPHRLGAVIQPPPAQEIDGKPCRPAAANARLRRGSGGSEICSSRNISLTPTAPFVLAQSARTSSTAGLAGSIGLTTRNRCGYLA